MSLREDAFALSEQLHGMDGVKWVDIELHGRVLRVGVILDHFDMDARGAVIEVIDAWHRAHVDEASVDFDIVDVHHVSDLFAHA